MPPYTGPSKERSTYSAKFIRVEDKLFTGEPDDRDTTHSEIARGDNVFLDIKRLLEENPVEIDGGSYFVHEDEITVIGNSWTLGIPAKEVEQDARDKTITLFKQQSPDYEIHKSDHI